MRPELIMPLGLSGPRARAGGMPVVLEARVQRGGELQRLVIAKPAADVVEVLDLVAGPTQAPVSALAGAVPADMFDPSEFPPQLALYVAPGDRVALYVRNVTRVRWWVRLLAAVSRLVGRRIFSKWDDRLSTDVKACVFVKVHG